MYKVRFHLGRGEHYRHWQIRGGVGQVWHYDPGVYNLFLSGCTLISQQGAAQKVLKSGKKDVCGWILCETWSAIFIDDEWLEQLADEEYPVDKLRRVWYNPINDTDWHVQGYPNSVTGLTFPELITKGNRVYCYDQD